MNIMFFVCCSIGFVCYIVVVVVVVVIVVVGFFVFNGKFSVLDVIFMLLLGQKVLIVGDLKGKVYFVNFWVMSCVICMQEMLQMVDIYNCFKGQGLEFVVVVMNYDLLMYVVNYVQMCQLLFKVVFDDGSVVKQFGNVQFMLMIFVVDKDGKILKCYVGVL